LLRKSPLTPLACLNGREKIAKEGKFLPFVKGGEKGFGLRCPYNYGPINTKVLIYVTPHPPLPLKGGGLGRG
jgi:hypothetical protein